MEVREGGADQPAADTLDQRLVGDLVRVRVRVGLRVRVGVKGEG